jgi:hypothetical protein
MDSTMILALVLLAVGLIAIGVFSNAKIFCLIAIAPILAIALDVSSTLPLVTTFLGASVLFLGYYAIWGGQHG